MKLLPARACQTLLAVSCVLGLCALPVAVAAGAELQILAGYAITAPLQKLAAQFERSSGDRIGFRFGTAPQLVDLLTHSAPFDLVVVPSDVLRSSAARARLETGPTIDVAHIWLAVAVRKGSARPDISTPEEFRNTLLRAPSIATLPASATGARILQILDKLGIESVVSRKIVAEPTPARVAQAVASGKAELALFLSNVLTAPGLDVIGPFPDGLQQDIVFTAGVAADTKRARAAEAFVRYLRSPAAAVVFRADGVTPGR